MFICYVLCSILDNLLIYIFLLILVSVKKLKTSNSSPPVFIRLPATAQFIEGGDAVFECQVSGNPMPNVVWTRRGAIIKNDDRHTVTYNPSTGQSILSIKNLTMDDDGEYNCTASNTAGEASLTVSITKQPQRKFNPILFKLMNYLIEKSF